jgi:cell division protein FtsB
MEPADTAQLKGLEATLERLAAEKVAAEAAIEQLLQKLPADPNLV